MKKQLSVILPTYNEKENIEELINQIVHYAGKDLHEIIVVDDNSPDGTWQIVKNLQKNIKKLKLNRRINERGLSSAIWAGIQQATGNLVLWMDCDLSHPPKEIPKLLEHVPTYDVVLASRFVAGGKDVRTFKRTLSSKAISIISTIILHTRIKDITSGYFLVKRKVFDTIKLKTTGYAEYCIRFVTQAKRKGYKIKEVGYVFTDREKGTSKSDANFKKYLYHGYLCNKEILRLFFRR